jgi:ABC-type transport system involved in cytochrome bd biosynthesis fused ATPase/permease subunit
MPPARDPLEPSLRAVEGSGQRLLTTVGFGIEGTWVTEIYKGKVTLDGIDVKTIGLRDLRSRMSIIPQDPVLFSGNVRKNLDPFDDATDSELWEALEKV